MLKVPDDEVLRITCRSYVLSCFIRNEGGEERLLGIESFILSRYLFKLLTSQELKRTFLFVTVVRNLGQQKTCTEMLYFLTFYFILEYS